MTLYLLLFGRSELVCLASVDASSIAKFVSQPKLIYFCLRIKYCMFVLGVT